MIDGPAVWEGDPGAATRVVVPMTVAFNVLLPRFRWVWPLWVLGNASAVHRVEEIQPPSPETAARQTALDEER